MCLTSFTHGYGDGADCPFWPLHEKSRCSVHHNVPRGRAAADSFLQTGGTIDALWAISRQNPSTPEAYGVRAQLLDRMWEGYTS